MIPIMESTGDIKLYKCIFIDSPKIDYNQYDKYYDSKLGGYYIEWYYVYNIYNRSHKQSRDKAHSDVIDSLPIELRKVFRNNENNRSCWGRVDIYNNRDLKPYNSCTDENTRDLINKKMMSNYNR